QATRGAHLGCREGACARVLHRGHRGPYDRGVRAHARRSRQAMTSRPLTVMHIDTERGWRGGERQTLWLAQRLARAGHRSLLVARPGQPLAERAAAAGWAVIPSTPGSELDIAAARWIRRAILVNEVDVVHAHTAHAVALAAMAARRTSARMVLTRRTTFPLRSNPFTRWKYRRAAAMIAIS